MVDLDGNGKPEILVSVRSNGEFVVYGETEFGRWTSLGTLANCGAREALLAGNFELATPPFKEIKVTDGRFWLQHTCVDPR
jgi:hypothetical protein